MYDMKHTLSQLCVCIWYLLFEKLFVVGSISFMVVTLVYLEIWCLNIAHAALEKYLFCHTAFLKTLNSCGQLQNLARFINGSFGMAGT